MPELPEVETIVRYLRREALPGRIITQVTVEWRPMVQRSFLDVLTELPGRCIERVERRGKYIVFPLSGEIVLLIHLKMSGRVYVCTADAPPDPYTRVTFALDDGREMRFRDPRKFGRVYLTPDIALVLGHLGPDPLEERFTAEAFLARINGRRGMIKPLLMDQSFLAGIGNIYADEALFQARIHPRRRAETLLEEEKRALYHAIRRVLVRSIELNGATLVDGMYYGGSFQKAFCVYSRGGQPCPVCGSVIERIKIGQRSSYFCPKCQT
ncbi:MAG: bifunctional DNA-formamidopyrimidine glycosylase/DNA-(apurinic or apyrimidinic site) lyase [Anaerolineae bacterium]